MFQAMVTRLHSPRTQSNPRNRNWRNPITDLMMPNTGSGVCLRRPLAGMIRCRRCGRKLTLRYTGAKHGIPRYSCSRAWMDNGEPHCIAFGGLRVDDAIEEALLTVVGPGAVAAAQEASSQAARQRDQV